MQPAILHADLADARRAFDHLDAAIEMRDPAVAPQRDDLRGDARFAARVERIAAGSAP